MQKTVSFFMTMLTFFVIGMSCSNTKKVTATRQDLKGNWVISAVAVEGADKSKLNITAFGDAALTCFEGSQWSFPNSGYGSYSLSKPGCSAGDRQIIWSQKTYSGVSYLNFKRVDGLKRSESKKVEDGYSMEIGDFSKDHFTLTSPVQFEGKTIYIVYHFNKQ